MNIMACYCALLHIPVIEQKQLLRKGKSSEVSFQSAGSGGVERFLLLDFRARAGAKGVFAERDTGTV